jgi:DNA polymerase III subunit epsilon
MEKLLFFDLETTGLDPIKNGIHQIAMTIFIDGKTSYRLNLKVKPHDNAIIEDSALEIAGIKKQDLESYIPMTEAYDLIIGMLSVFVDKYNKQDKFHLAGYNNASFDNQFLRQFFIQNNDKYFGSWFWSDSIDVMVLASNKLKSVRHEMENFKQSTVAKKLGIELDETKLHDALYDLDICYKIYKLVS